MPSSAFEVIISIFFQSHILCYFQLISSIQDLLASHKIHLLIHLRCNNQNCLLEIATFLICAHRWMLRGSMIFKICNAHHHLFVHHLSCMLQFWQFCRVAEEVLCDFERWDRKNHHMRHPGGSRSTTWAHVHIPHTETVGLSLLFTTVFLNLLLRDESW